MTKRAVLYARVSGDDRDREDRNLLGQLDLCRRYALEHGYQIVEELAEDDRGACGADPHRRASTGLAGVRHPGGRGAG
jgi:DNA invertase Pin-like site-specific DNA recombinase